MKLPLIFPLVSRKRVPKGAETKVFREHQERHIMKSIRQSPGLLALAFSRERAQIAESEIHQPRQYLLLGLGRQAGILPQRTPVGGFEHALHGLLHLILPLLTTFGIFLFFSSSK